MARARNIKPGFFKNESLAECTAWARLCFAGLWTLADREGRLEDRPKRIKGELFAFDSIEVEPLLKELARFGFIERYASDGLGLIQILSFHKHQNPHHREPKSDLPPPQSPGLCVVATASKPEALTQSDDAKAPDKPEASPGLDPPRSDLAIGSSREDPGALNPEPGSRSPESGVNTRSPTYRPENDGFAVWWEAYRRKDSKQDAAKAWKALKPDAAMQAVMLSALARWPWAKDRVHIPLPATWLRGKRWEDEAITGSIPAESTGPQWFEIAGFPNADEALNCRCHGANYTKFHEGKRIADDGVSH